MAKFASRFTRRWTWIPGGRGNNSTPGGPGNNGNGGGNGRGNGGGNGNGNNGNGNGNGGGGGGPPGGAAARYMNASYFSVSYSGAGYI